MESNSRERRFSTASSLTNQLKELTTEWLLNTTSHGLPSIVRAKYVIIKIVWALCFLAAFCYCTFAIVKIVMDFIQFKTTISTEYIAETPTTFPAITFCNLNPFNEDKAMEYIDSKLEDFNDIECVSGDIKNSSIWNITECNPDYVLISIIDKLKRVISNDDLTLDELYENGFDLSEDMLISCDFNGIECDANNFTKFWNNEYGFCYTFNGGKNAAMLKTSAAGPKSGLKMELVVEPLTSTLYSYRSGIYLLAHNQSLSTAALSGGITVGAGETYIGVSRTFLAKQGSPYSDCIKDLTPFSTYSRKLFKYFNELNVTYYDQDICITLCYQDKLGEKCGCNSLIIKSLENFKYCQTTSQIKCENEYLSNFSSSNINELCDNVCRQQCSSETLELITSQASYPSQSYLEFLQSIKPDKFPETIDTTELYIFAKRSLVRFIVNYNERFYTNIVENPAITPETLLGNVGGQLGLFIGISILSLIEILEIVLNFFILICLRLFKRETVHNTPVESLPK